VLHESPSDSILIVDRAEESMIDAMMNHGYAFCWHVAESHQIALYIMRNGDNVISVMASPESDLG
jgi:hypothetical protein